MTEWTIHIDDNTVIEADAATSSPSEINTIERGQTSTFSFYNFATNFIIDFGETYTIESGETLEVSFVTINGTLVVDGELKCDELTINGALDNNGTVTVNDKFAFEYNEAQRYSPFTGKFTLMETLSAKQPYREFISDSTDIDTLLIGIEPSQDLKDKDLIGYWGLLNNITDNRNRTLTTTQIELELTVLAQYDEYNTFSDVQNDLEV